MSVRVAAWYGIFKITVSKTQRSIGTECENGTHSIINLYLHRKLENSCTGPILHESDLNYLSASNSWKITNVTTKINLENLPFAHERRFDKEKA